MFWEKITIEGTSTITIEKDLVRETVRWSVLTANRITSGEAPTVEEAVTAALKAATGQERKTTDEAVREFGVFDLLDR